MERQTFGRWTLATALALAATAAFSTKALAQNVSTEAELRAAYLNAHAGSVITLNDGTYTLIDRLITRDGGTEQSPIIVRAAHPNGAEIITNGAQQAFQVLHPYWRFENLFVHVTRGTPYGYKIEGNAHHVTVSGGKIQIEPGSEAGVKGSGTASAPWPDFATIENTEIFLTAPTLSSMAEGIDAVAVDGWTIRNNVIHGMRTADRTVAFGAMTKGNCRNTVIEGNLFYDNFIGISLGGGGTDPVWMRDGDRTLESRGGIIRNNMVMGSDDVAIYLYIASDAKVYNNTLYNSYTTCGSGCGSIDVRMPGASADIRNNIIDKPIRNREGGTSSQSSNMQLATPTDSSWFVDVGSHNLRLRAGAAPIDRGEALSSVPSDIDHDTRPFGPAYDVGAHEFGANNPTNPPPNTGNPPPNTGNPPPNTGNPPPNTGNPPPSDPGTPTGGTTPPNSDPSASAPPSNNPPSDSPPADPSAATGAAPNAATLGFTGSVQTASGSDGQGLGGVAPATQATISGGCNCLAGVAGGNGPSALFSMMTLLLPAALVELRRKRKERAQSSKR